MPRYGAIDIGSNSVRMQIADAVVGHSPTILAEDREVTRLGVGVFRSGQIDAEATEQVCQFLARSAAAFAKHQVLAVRAVATAAVRDANNQEAFLESTRQALGFPVEVISGQEEARLIHLGVHSRWPHPKQTILIIDIGGGSAELILSRRGHVVEAFSRNLGAVRLTELLLRKDPPTPLELHQLDEFIEEKLEPAIRHFKQRPDRTIATSATASAIACAVHRVPRSKRDLADQLRVSRAELEKLLADLSSMSLLQRRQVPGIGPRRAEVIIPGCAVLLRVLRDLELPSVYFSRAGVRDGIIADLLARGVGRELTRLDSDQLQVIRELARRYGISLKHGDKVASIASSLFESLQNAHRLAPNYGRLLEAAAYLHDVGHFVSDTRHHRHSYYLVANSDLPGFTDRERLIVANLCRYHRKALPTAQHDNFRLLSAEEQNAIRVLIPLLRLSDSLDRGHQQRAKQVQTRLWDGHLEVLLDSPENTDLEEWAAQRVGDEFQQIYGISLVVGPKRARRG